ncbi:lipopolysaccharide heptosyltransferase II [candidate division KSB1 bacterium]
MKVLIVQTAFLGDVILTIPLIRALKKHIKPVHLHILLRPEAEDVYRNDKDIDNIIVYDKKNSEKGIQHLFKLIKKVRAEKYELVISPHRSVRSALISYLSGAKQRVGFDKNSMSILYNKKVKYINDKHEVERNLSLIEPIYDGEISITLNMQNSENDRKKADELISNTVRAAGQDIVCMAPGSEWSTKRWLTEYYRKLIKLCSLSDIKVVLLGGSKDKNICGNISIGFENVTDLSAKLSVNESSEVMKQCKLLVCNDTGAMHIGSASGIDIITVFGPTVPEFGFSPFGVKNKILQSDIYCRPCSIHGGENCPEGHFLCMRSITPDDVMQEIRRFLN